MKERKKEIEAKKWLDMKNKDFGIGIRDRGDQESYYGSWGDIPGEEAGGGMRDAGLRNPYL